MAVVEIHQAAGADDADLQGSADLVETDMAEKVKREQVRREGNVRLNPGELEGLAESIRRHGIRVPLQVYPVDGDGYGLLDGDRRLIAAEMAGLDEVPVDIVERPDGRERVIHQLIVNMQREDLNPIDQAHAYSRLVEMGCTQRDVAEWMGINEAKVSQTVALLKLVPDLQEAVRAGELSARAGYHLSQLCPDDQGAMAKSAIAARSARRVERMVRVAQAMGMEAQTIEREVVADVDPLQLLALEDAKRARHHLDSIRGVLPVDEALHGTLESALFEVEDLMKEIWRLM